MLDWFPNADHVGLYEALANGDFTKAGLDVHLRCRPTRRPRCSCWRRARSMWPSLRAEVLLARDQGQPLVAIGAIVQRPLTSIVSLGSKHITSASHLAREAVGDAGIPYQQAYLSTILAHAGVPASSVKEINVGDNLVPAMLSGGSTPRWGPTGITRRSSCASSASTPM